MSFYFTQSKCPSPPNGLPRSRWSINSLPPTPSLSLIIYYYTCSALLTPLYHTSDPSSNKPCVLLPKHLFPKFPLPGKHLLYIYTWQTPSLLQSLSSSLTLSKGEQLKQPCVLPLVFPFSFFPFLSKVYLTPLKYVLLYLFFMYCLFSFSLA